MTDVSARRAERRARAPWRTLWRMRFNVRSATPAAELVRRIGIGVSGLPGWSRQADRNCWISDQHGHRVTLHATTIPGPSVREYELELTVSAEAE